MSAEPALVHSPADILRWAMVAQGIGADPRPASGPLGAWPIYASSEPDTGPDNVLTVFNTAPRYDGRLFPTGESVNHHGFQIRIRAATDPIGSAKLYSIQRALSNGAQFGGLLNDVEITRDGSQYVVHCVTNLVVALNGREEPKTRRWIYTLNGFVVITAR